MDIYILEKWKSWMMLAGKDTAKSFLKNKRKQVISQLPLSLKKYYLFLASAVILISPHF